MGKKGQVTAEFIIIFSLMLAVLGISMGVVWTKIGQVQRSKEDLRSMEVLNGVKKKVDTVYLEGDGFRTNLTLPESVSGKSYSLGVEWNQVFINVSGEVYSRNLLTTNVTGSFRSGVNLLENKDGRVVINGG